MTRGLKPRHIMNQPDIDLIDKFTKSKTRIIVDILAASGQQYNVIQLSRLSRLTPKEVGQIVNKLGKTNLITKVKDCKVSSYYFYCMTVDQYKKYKTGSGYIY